MIKKLEEVLLNSPILEMEEAVDTVYSNGIGFENHERILPYLILGLGVVVIGTYSQSIYRHTYALVNNTISFAKSLKKPTSN